MVHSGDIIDGLTYITNFGNSIACGGNGGSHYYIEIPDGYLFAGCSGEYLHPGNHDYWRTVHNLIFYFVPRKPEPRR